MKKLSSVLVLFLFIPFFTFASLVGDRTIPVEVAQLSDSLKRMYAPDKRVALFDVDYSFAGKNVMLRGVTTSAEAKAALLQGLAKADYKVMDCIQVLPDVKGLEGKTYGIINVSVANLRAAPDFSSEMMTQGLMGMPVHVLQRDGWVHIQTPDNYIAWVHRVGVHLVNEAEMAAWNNAEKIVVTAHYGFVYSKPDRTSQTISDVVAGNRFKWDGSKGAFYKVIYPDGRQGYISKSIAMPEKKWRSGLKQDAADIIGEARKTAERLLKDAQENKENAIEEAKKIHEDSLRKVEEEKKQCDELSAQKAAMVNSLKKLTEDTARLMEKMQG